MHRIPRYALLAMTSTILAAQTSPVKMGLWEKTVVTTGGPAGTRTLKAKSCVTPETWEEMVANSTKQRPGCTINTTKTAKGYSFTGSCTLEHGVSIEMKGSSSIEDSEHITGESHTTTSMNGKTTQMDLHSTSHFVASNCGAVKPGEPEIEDH